MSANTAKLAEGLNIRFIPREGPSEAKTLPYYDYYSSLTGKIAKIYDDGAVAVLVDRDSLPDSFLERHEKHERDMRDKWLKSISEDDRSKLSDSQKKFSLRYTLLVAPQDLAIVDEHIASSALEEKAQEKKVKAKRVAEGLNRPKSEDYDSAEEQYLNEKRRSQPE